MNVLVTRPDIRGQQLVEMLVEKQIFALHQPLFRAEAGRELPQLPSLFAHLNAGDYVFAVSKNAVDFAHQTLVETGFGWRNDLRYFAVGQGTANYFASLSEQAVRFPTLFTNSEGLLALPEMQALAGTHIVILRAEHGRELFAEQDQLRGATVQTVECYQRILFSENLSDKISLAKRAGIDAIIATSSDILTTLFEQTAEADREWLLACRVVVVGGRIAMTACQLGWQPNAVIIADKADNHSLCQTILQYHTS